MLHKLFPRLAKTAPPLPQPNAQLALGALLVRIALADRDYQVTEVSQIDKVLAATFNLKPLEAAKLRAASEALERHAPGTPEFATLLRSEVPYEDRVRLADAMWSIALADGTKDASEEELLLATEAALGLSDEDIAAVRERALKTN
ncbi:MAG: TerB family tellurite resistance protein [Roseobacter sp.]